MKRLARTFAFTFTFLLSAFLPLVAGDVARLNAMSREKRLTLSQVHRAGGWDAMPENSVIACLWCWGHGLGVEVDPQMTTDGVLFAFHDGNLKRIGTDVPPAIMASNVWELAWNDIRDVDVGAYLGKRYEGTRIATMESILSQMQYRPERILYADVKTHRVDLFAKCVAHYGVAAQIFFTTPIWENAVTWKKYAPTGLTMVWLYGWAESNSPEEIARSEAKVGKPLDEMEAMGFKDIDQVQIQVRIDATKADPFCPSTAFLKRTIARLHAKGVLVQAALSNEDAHPDCYRQLWDLGFDSFTTDYPEAFLKFLREVTK